MGDSPTTLRTQLSEMRAPSPSGSAWLIALLLPLLGVALILTFSLVAHEMLRATPGPLRFPLSTDLGSKLVQSLFPDVSAAREQRAAALDELPQIRALLRTDPEDAERRMVELHIHEQQAPATASARNEELYALLLEDLQRLKELTARKRATVDELKRNSQEAGELMAAVTEIRDGVSRRLGITTELPKVELETAQFYQAGILAGLPQIEGIPDGIATVGAIFESARRLGATRRVSTEREYDDFQEAIDGFRTAASALPKRLESITATRQPLLAERDTIAEEVKTRIATTEDHLLAWISAFPESAPIWNFPRLASR